MLVDMLVQRGVGAIGRGKRELAREEFVQNGSRRVHVGTRPQLRAHGLLRSDIGRRAQDLACHCRGSYRAANDLGQPEVSHLYLFVPGEHQVVRLDVSVKDTVPVGVSQGCAQPEQNGAGLLRREAFGLEAIPDRPTGHVLHNQEAQAVLVDKVVDRDNVRVIERGQEARFRSEATAHYLISSESSREHFDRHLPGQLSMLSSQNHSPGPPPQLLTDVVGGEGGYDSIMINPRGN